jgi:hypothetical protein
LNSFVVGYFLREASVQTHFLVLGQRKAQHSTAQADKKKTDRHTTRAVKNKKKTQKKGPRRTHGQKTVNKGEDKQQGQRLKVKVRVRV